MFFCDPPGDTQPQNLMNFKSGISNLNYIFFHDQEPIHLDVHAPLFESVVSRNNDLDFSRGPRHKAIVTSEYQSEFVEEACRIYGWKSYYYFFHGWAALDWYRGYDRTFLIDDPKQRFIFRSFVNPNRIIGGRRDHRVLLMYHLLRLGVGNAHMSFPNVCPVENVLVTDIARQYQDRYPDIVNVFEHADLPMNFKNEHGHPMHSCWLSLFDECNESLAYVVTETVYHGKRHHLTEKTFKPMCMKMPFVLVSTAGSLRYLRQYGFKTFDGIWDESYDDEPDDLVRLEKISSLLRYLDNLPQSELQFMYQKAVPILEHNYEHFYGGNFEKRLWLELDQMLLQLQEDLA